MEKIVILDMGGQYAHLLARRIRQLGVYSEILPCDADAEKLKDAKGIIISGGPSSVYESNAPKCDPKLFSLSVPILGLCYGHQLMAQSLNGRVTPGSAKEYGTAELSVANNEGLFSGLSGKELVWMSHGDAVEEVPAGFEILASTTDCRVAAMGNKTLNYYGMQFHPEVTHTRNGMKMLENFLKICNVGFDWSMENFIPSKIEEIKKQVGKRNVFLLVSGGVDSTVCFALLNKALGSERVYGLHIDNGFMRENESMHVDVALRELGFENFQAIDAGEEFLSAIGGIIDPEQKRKSIGETFIAVQKVESEKLGLNSDEWLLGQGTIYPDTIETGGTKNADLIKTHHNRVGAVQELIIRGLVIEPIKELYKDEVRELGLQLGLRRDMIFRKPFPGPGLAIRCLCSDGNESVENEAEINENANAIAAPYGLRAKVLPVKSVGVQGDSRTYRHPIALMGKADNATLEKVSTELTNAIGEINRVLLTIAPEEIEGAKTISATITAERLETLRNADAIANYLAEKEERIWQFPVILIPLTLNGGESIVLRPVESKEAMTANWASLSRDMLEGMSTEIMGINGIDAVFLDITNKPPATIEWE